jgi:hypothetical protein
MCSVDWEKNVVNVVPVGKGGGLTERQINMYDIFPAKKIVVDPYSMLCVPLPYKFPLDILGKCQVTMNEQYSDYLLYPHGVERKLKMTVAHDHVFFTMVVTNPFGNKIEMTELKTGRFVSISVSSLMGEKGMMKLNVVEAKDLIKRKSKRGNDKKKKEVSGDNNTAVTVLDGNEVDAGVQIKVEDATAADSLVNVHDWSHNVYSELVSVCILYGSYRRVIWVSVSDARMFLSVSRACERLTDFFLFFYRIHSTTCFTHRFKRRKTHCHHRYHDPRNRNYHPDWPRGCLTGRQNEHFQLWHLRPHDVRQRRFSL